MGRCQANARGAAGHQHHLARHGAAQAVIDVQGRVQMALPVIPQAPAVVRQLGAANARALERCLHVAAVKTRGVVHKAQHVVGQAQVFHDGVADAAHRRQRHQAFCDAARNKAQERGVDKHIHLGCVRGPAEDVQHLAHAVALRVHQVVALVGNAALVADGVQRVDHKIHRHDVDAPALQADGGHPGRKDLAHALDQLEEVIRPVDLVHLAGLAVTHHHGRAVHRPGNLAFGADDFFALVLGSEVGMLVVLCLLKHVLSEHALVQTSCGNAGHMVEVSGG